MIPEIEELNIGHTIVSNALFWGLEEAVRRMRELVDAAMDAGDAFDLSRANIYPKHRLFVIQLVLEINVIAVRGPVGPLQESAGNC